MDKLTEFLKTTLPGLMEDFDLKNYLPKLDTLWGTVELLIRIFVMAGPLILLGLGLWYFLAPPKEANHRAGFRTLWGMGSVEAWRFTQKVAGIAFSVVGFVLTVIMAIICNGYRNMEPMDTIQSAGVCILWQVGLVLGITVIIHLIPMFFFDWKGTRRSEKRKNA